MLAVFFFFHLAKLKSEFFWEIQIGISEFRKDLACGFWASPKTDQESLKSTLRMDSSDQMQIHIFEIHHLSVYSGKGFENSIFDQRFSVFRTKTGYWQQVPYMYKTEPMLVTPFFIRTYHFPEKHKGVMLSWKWSFFRIFHFFGSKESIGSEITNLFLNSTKRRTPRRSGTQVQLNES